MARNCIQSGQTPTGASHPDSSQRPSPRQKSIIRRNAVASGHMYKGPHYKLKRLSLPPSDLGGHADGISPTHKTPIRSVFMPPPEDEPAIKYGAVVRETLETVDSLRMSLIAMRNTRPLLEVLELANNCKQVVNQLSDFIMDPILFAGSFAEYYLKFLKEFQVDQRRAVEDIRFALGGWIPSVVQACERVRVRIVDVRRVYDRAVRELDAFLQDQEETDEKIARTHPFTLKNVQTLRKVLHNFDRMDDFCRYYGEYFGQEQQRHLRHLLQGFEDGSIFPASRQENNTIIDLWTRYDRFMIHLPTEIDGAIQFFQSSGGGYKVCSTEFSQSTASSPSIYLPSPLPDYADCGGIVRRRKIPTGRVRVLERHRGSGHWLCDRILCWYRRFQLWLDSKHFAD